MAEVKKNNLGNIKDFFIKTFNGMALGLFSTLIIGTIIGRIGIILDIENSNIVLSTITEGLRALSSLLTTLTGVGIGIGIAFSMKLEGLKLIGAGVAGGIASGLITGKPGDPMVEYFCVIFAILFVELVMRKKTPLDILIIPFLYAISAFLIYVLINSPVKAATTAIGNFIRWATEVQPFFMGIIIAVVMGMLLTAPISSAAIAIAITLDGLAGGAAVVGCSVQMLGFAVMSRKDNNIGTIISVGIGTSMLQFKNILKKPIIWLPTIIVSAILGPLATLVFKTQTTHIGSGMGTSGLVGQFETYSAMAGSISPWPSILILQIALPIILVYIVDLIFRKKGWIKEGDLKI